MKAKVFLHELNLDAEKAKKIKRIIITACGTAAHAGMVGKILIEHIARVPVETAIASEFRYADPLVDEDTVVLGDQPVRRDGRYAGRNGRRTVEGRYALVDCECDRLPGHAHR